MTFLGGYEVWVDPAGGNGGGSDWKAGVLWPLDGVPTPPDDPHASIIAGFSYGNQFSVNQEGTAEGIRFWRSDTEAMTSRKLSLIAGFDGITVYGEVTTVDEVGSNEWVYAQLPAPVDLYPGASFYVAFDVATNAGRQSQLVGGNVPAVNYTGGGFAQAGTPFTPGSLQTYWVDIGYKPLAGRSRSAPKTKAAKSTKKAAKRA